MVLTIKLVLFNFIYFITISASRKLATKILLKNGERKDKSVFVFIELTLNITSFNFPELNHAILHIIFNFIMFLFNSAMKQL